MIFNQKIHKKVTTKSTKAAAAAKNSFTRYNFRSAIASF